MAHLRVHEVHLTHAALVLLIGCDLLRIGGPQQNRAVAFRPAGVVRGVAEVLHTVGGELGFRARCHFPHPEVVIADKSRFFLVRGQRGTGSACAAATTSASAPSTAAPAGCRRAHIDRALIIRQRALPALTHRAERDGRAILRERYLLERELGRLILRVGRRGKRCREPGVIERGGACAFCRVHQHEFRAVFTGHPIPEAIARQPVRPDARAEHQWGCVVGHEFLGVGVVRSGQNFHRLLGEAGGEEDEKEREHRTHRCRVALSFRQERLGGFGPLRHLPGLRNFLTERLPADEKHCCARAIKFARIPPIR